MPAIQAIKPIQEKVVAYITRGDQLLLFRHTKFPEAGLQVPAGTVEDGEAPEEAVLREAREETGLQNLVLRAYLGEQMLDLTPYGRDGFQRRYFFHLECLQPADDTWRHWEQNRSDSSEVPIEFEFFWVRFPDKIPLLSGELGTLLNRLRV